MDAGKAPVRMGNAHASVVPYQTFPTTDGWMLIACGNDGQFVKMMQVLGDPAMAQDERYKTNAARVVNRDTKNRRSLFEPAVVGNDRCDGSPGIRCPARCAYSPDEPT